MKRFFALMSVAVIALAAALPVSAGEASPSYAYDTLSAPVAAIATVPFVDSAAGLSQDTPTTIDATALPTTQERTQVAALFYLTWIAWCPSTGSYTCKLCCPPMNR